MTDAKRTTVMARERSDEAIQTGGYRSRSVWIASSLTLPRDDRAGRFHRRAAIAVLAVKVKPLRGRVANPDSSARRWLVATMSFWCAKRPNGRAAHQKDMDAKRRAAEPQSRRRRRNAVVGAAQPLDGGLAAWSGTR